jgi:hypothetical protein
LEFDQLEGSGFGACVSRVAYLVAANGDTSSIWVFFLGSNFAHNTCIGEVMSPVCWYVIVVDGAKCVSAVNSLGCRVVFLCANSLAETTEFIGIGFVP